MVFRLLLLLVVVLAATAALQLHAELAMDSTAAACSDRPARVEFVRKKQWEHDIGAARLVTFAIPEWASELFAYFDPSRLSALNSGSGVRALCGTVAVDSVPASTFYHWCWDRTTAATTGMRAQNRHWFSLGNGDFLRNTHLRARMQQVMDPLLGPLTPFTSSHDMLWLSHRTPVSTHPYFVHFQTRRVLAAAYGSFRFHYVPWDVAQRYVHPAECALPSAALGPETTHAAAWVLSSSCDLRRRNLTFGVVTVPQGMQLVVPRGLLYTLEHVSPNVLRDQSEQCCVILQADYRTRTNTLKNWMFLQHPARGHVLPPVSELSSVAHLDVAVSAAGGRPASEGLRFLSAVPEPEPEPKAEHQAQPDNETTAEKGGNEKDEENKKETEDGAPAAPAGGDTHFPVFNDDVW